MALKEACDVFGTINGVEQFRIAIFKLDTDGNVAGEPVKVLEKSLCPRALKRLITWIDRASSPPKKPKKD